MIKRYEDITTVTQELLFDIDNRAHEVFLMDMEQLGEELFTVKQHDEFTQTQWMCQYWVFKFSQIYPDNNKLANHLEIRPITTFNEYRRRIGPFIIDFCTRDCIALPIGVVSLNLHKGY